ncbi:hypothetical protein [Cellulomonas sp. NPDC089187]|uniref:hypothetical protein n=1 Tax=Cellulomonas sp. NPDC089187 TaxID=3154970 RepID=UPI00342C6926
MPGGIAAHHPPGEDHLTRQIAALRTELRRLRAEVATTVATASGVTARVTASAVAARTVAPPAATTVDGFAADTAVGFTGPVLALPVTGQVRVSIDCDQVLIDPGTGSATAGLAWGVESADGSDLIPLHPGPGSRSALLRTDAGVIGGSLSRSGTTDGTGDRLVARAWVHCTDPAATVTFGPCTLRVDPL